MFWGVSYTLYTYSLHHNFGQAPTVEKFNPQLTFHNSNIAENYYNGWCHCNHVTATNTISVLV